MSEPQTEAGRKLDLAWPGTHMDRLDWQAAIVAVEEQAASRETARDALALLQAARESGVMLAATEAAKLAAALSSPETTPAGVLPEKPDPPKQSGNCSNCGEPYATHYECGEFG